MERQEFGTISQFRNALRRAKHTFMGCDCCGYLPVPREELLTLANHLGEAHTARWRSVDQVPNSIVFLV